MLYKNNFKAFFAHSMKSPYMEILLSITKTKWKSSPLTYSFSGFSSWITWRSPSCSFSNVTEKVAATATSFGQLGFSSYRRVGDYILLVLKYTQNSLVGASKDFGTSILIIFWACSFSTLITAPSGTLKFIIDLLGESKSFIFAEKSNLGKFSLL